MILAAIVHEDDKPVRIFKDKACLHSAYMWAHRHYCLEDIEPQLKVWQLPDWLKVTFHMFTDEQFNELAKID